MMCLASLVTSCQPHLVPQDGRGDMPVIVETVYHFKDKVAVPPAARRQTVRRYFDDIQTFHATHPFQHHYHFTQ
jgi:hypothetical protein